MKPVVCVLLHFSFWLLSDSPRHLNNQKSSFSKNIHFHLVCFCWMPYSGHWDWRHLSNCVINCSKCSMTGPNFAAVQWSGGISNHQKAFALNSKHSPLFLCIQKTQILYYKLYEGGHIYEGPADPLSCCSLTMNEFED